MWNDINRSVSEMTVNGYSLSVVKWRTCWGWHIEKLPVDETQPLIAKGRAKTRTAAKRDVCLALEKYTSDVIRGAQ